MRIFANQHSRQLSDPIGVREKAAQPFAERADGDRVQSLRPPPERCSPGSNDVAVGIGVFALGTGGGAAVAFVGRLHSRQRQLGAEGAPRSERLRPCAARQPGGRPQPAHRPGGAVHPVLLKGDGRSTDACG